MRGKADRADGRRKQKGITPAHAGKRDLQNTDFAGWRDHPRACGEKLSPSTSLVMPSGSPPHMRGKVSAFPDSGKTAGITPAHAEKSVPVDTSTLQQRDHPRTCGEKRFRLMVPPVMLGSPPHMRGKACCCLNILLHDGITPAHAGKSRWTLTNGRLRGDHPRTCGEKTLRTWTAIQFMGSPPHMRGKAYTSVAVKVFPGITPAHAGKRPA